MLITVMMAVADPFVHKFLQWELGWLIVNEDITPRRCRLASMVAPFLSPSVDGRGAAV